VPICIEIGSCIHIHVWTWELGHTMDMSIDTFIQVESLTVPHCIFVVKFTSSSRLVRVCAFDKSMFSV